MCLIIWGRILKWTETYKLATMYFHGIIDIIVTYNSTFVHDNNYYLGLNALAPY